MPKIQHVYLEVMPDGKVMEGVPIELFHCKGCHYHPKKGVCKKERKDAKCFSRNNPLKKSIIYKDTGKRVRKG